MADFTPKIFIVQRASGDVIAAKLTYLAAHTIAKANAPAKILFTRADKTLELNVTDYDPGHKPVQLIANRK